MATTAPSLPKAMALTSVAAVVGMLLLWASTLPDSQSLRVVLGVAAFAYCATVVALWGRFVLSQMRK